MSDKKSKADEKVMLKRESGKSDESLVTNMISSPIFTGANTHTTLNRVAGLDNYQPSTSALIEHLKSLTKSGKTGEEALLVQAATLDKLFNHMIQLTFGEKESYPTEHFELWLKFALRAQSQCRTTYEAISAIRHPRIQYVGEQYNAGGHMQVNNTPTSEDSKNPQNELTEGLPNDAGTARSSSDTNKAESAVVEINRSQKRRRQS